MLEKLNKFVHRNNLGNKEKLIVVFSSIGDGGNPGPELVGTMESLNYSALFCTDLSFSWYTNKECLKSILKTLMDTIKTNNPKEVIFIGQSMGGHAAIKFAEKIKQCTKCIALSPQIDPYHYFKVKYNGNKPKNVIGVNIKIAFRNDIPYYLFYGDSIDIEQLSFVKDRNNIKKRFIVNHHNILVHLKDNNELLPLLKEYIE